jgi:hypothetical protein
MSSTSSNPVNQLDSERAIDAQLDLKHRIDAHLIAKDAFIKSKFAYDTAVIVTKNAYTDAKIKRSNVAAVKNTENENMAEELAQISEQKYIDSARNQMNLWYEKLGHGFASNEESEIVSGIWYATHPFSPEPQQLMRQEIKGESTITYVMTYNDDYFCSKLNNFDYDRVDHNQKKRMMLTSLTSLQNIITLFVQILWAKLMTQIAIVFH